MIWKKIIVNGPEPTFRHGHRAIAVGEYIYFYGGGDSRIINDFHGYSSRENKYFSPILSGAIMCPGVANFGMVIYENVIIIFGGMVEYGHYSNDLYSLSLATFSWKKYGKQAKDVPKARMGHSFTLTDDRRIIVFAGITNNHIHPKKYNLPKYMNDLYILYILGNEKFKWQLVPTTENFPCPRESHSAVFHVMDGTKYIIVFGGMNGERLGDLWFLELKELIWMQFEIFGIPTAPRSLHSTALIGSKMYIFGGWVEKQPKRPADAPPTDRFETTNLLSYLDLKKMEWVHFVNYDELCPPPRAGHSLVSIGSRLYLWGGRSSYKKRDIDNICIKDFWYMETEIPQKISEISLIKATKSTIEIEWNCIQNAECYLLEIHKVKAVPVDISKIRIKTNLCINNSNNNNDQKINSMIETIQIKDSSNENNNKRKSDNFEDEPVEKKQIIEENEENVDEKQQNEKKIEKKCINPLKIVQNVETSWLTVGLIKSNGSIIDGYYPINLDTTNLDFKTCQKFADFDPQTKIKLSASSMFAVRVAAINLMGTSEWSKMFSFKTTDVDVPTAPSNCKFIPTNCGVRLAWNPNPLGEKVSSYFVYMAISKCFEKNQYNYLRVYEGVQPTCHVMQSSLDGAYKQKLFQDEAVIFRITAGNSAGISPALMANYNLSRD